MSTREEIVHFLDSNDEDAFEHFGVKGMKWGVIRSKVQGRLAERAEQKAKDNVPNPDYNSGMRQRDRLRFTGGGIRRINANMNRGMTYQQASKKELDRKKVQQRVTIGIVATATLVEMFGPVVMSEISRKAATNRDKRAQATEDFIRNGPQKPATKTAKKNIRGVYNITTM